MLLSEKQKKFSQFFSAFFKSRLGLEHFQKKKIPLIADVFSKLRAPKNVVRKMSKNSGFRRPFHKQYGKRDKTLLKYEQQHFYHIY